MKKDKKSNIHKSKLKEFKTLRGHLTDLGDTMIILYCPSLFCTFTPQTSKL